MPAESATGVPNPASASSSAPKQKAMRMAWIAQVVRDRGEGAAQDREVTGRVGHVEDPDRRDDDPHDREQAERGALGGRARAWPTGIGKTTMATRIARASAAAAAHWARTRSPPKRANRISRGSTAKSEDSPSEGPTGS